MTPFRTRLWLHLYDLAAAAERASGSVRRWSLRLAVASLKYGYEAIPPRYR